MEWYWILAIVVAFVGIVALLIYLGKKGILSGEVMDLLKVISGSLTNVVDRIKDMTNDPSMVYLDKAVELLNMAVQAAENLWYNGEIEKDERYEACQKIFEELLNVYEIDLGEDFMAVKDAVIRAACEMIGHGRYSKEALEETVVETVTNE